MNPLIEEKIQPYLIRSLQDRRRQIVVNQVQAAMALEEVEERIEEREYDEQEHLRKHRVIDRRVLRQEAVELYASFAAELKSRGVAELELRSTLTDKLENELDAIADERALKADLSGAVRKYRGLVPVEQWPVVLAMTPTPQQASSLKLHLGALGFQPAADDLLEKFGIVRFACPPEMSFLREIASLPQVTCLADPLTPISAPRPIEVSTQMVEARALLEVTREISETFGEDVTLAILDTGADLSHPALQRIRLEDYRNFSGGEDDDADGHGTHVASIAAGDDPSSGGRYSGIAPKCRLVVAKVVDGDALNTLENILRGMAWVVFEKRADVLSMSIGDTETPANGRSIWSRACEEAFRQGTVVCAAAGNVPVRMPETIIVPADSAFAVAVGAIDKEGRLAVFSALGSDDPNSPLYGKPDCVAPGVGIVAARSSRSALPPLNGTDFLHTALSGTSMAAPAVAGCLALIKSMGRMHGWEMSPREVLEIYFAASRPLADPAGEPYSNKFEVGRGLVNMRVALAEVQRRILAGRSRPITGLPKPARPESPPPPNFAPPGSQGAEMKATSDPRLQDAFLNGFEHNVRAAGSVRHPADKEELWPDSKVPVQSFRCPFGQVKQVPLKTRFRKKIRMVLAAVALNEPPPPDLIRQITSSNGLDLDDRVFSAIGVFSPIGWSEEWRGQARPHGNAHFYLVQKGEDTVWEVLGPSGPFQRFFDPETDEEKQERAAAALAKDEELLLSGGQRMLESFLEDYHLDRATVETAISNSDGRYQIIVHKGRSLIQRTLR